MPDTFAVPSAFIEAVQSRCAGIAELHVALASLRLADTSGSVLQSDLCRDEVLQDALRAECEHGRFETAIGETLAALSDQGLVHLDRQSHETVVTVDLIRSTDGSSEVSQFGSQSRIEGTVETEEQESSAHVWAFRLYEQQIGPLSPLVADQIAHAVQIYPEDWIRDAIRDAVNYNRRSWRYIQRILANWAGQSSISASQEQRSHETRRGSPEESFDPSRYRKGKHLERAKRTSM